MKTVDDYYQFVKTNAELFDGSHMVFTPRLLVEKILDKIDLKNKKILVLFNLEFVLSLVYTYKVDPAAITLYADHDTKINFVQRLGVKYITDLDIEMKFDVVVGNPPYQAPKKGDYSFWARFVDTAHQQLTDGGQLSMIIPAGWMSPTIDIRQGRKSVMRDIFAKENTSYINIDPALGKKYFPGIGQKFTWFTLQKGDYVETIIDLGDKTVTIDLEKMPMLAKDTDEMNISIIQKICSGKDKWEFTRTIMPESWDDLTFEKTVENTFPRINGNSNHLDKVAYSINPCKFQTTKKVVLPYNGSLYKFVVDNGQAGCTNAYVAPLSDLDRIDSATVYFNSKLISWLGKNKFTQYNEGSLINAISKMNLTVPLTEKKIYKHYKLTNEEIAYIEANTK